MRSVIPVRHTAQIAKRKIVVLTVGHAAKIHTEVITLQTIVHANLATLKTQKMQPAIAVIKGV